jgi:hypothetical protein
MTVCVGVAVHDCLVFAADSASTVVTTDPSSGQSHVLNVYRHGNKVFNLHKGLPICAMTAGMGNIGTWSIGLLAKMLRQKLMADENWQIDPSAYTIQDVAERARRFLFDEKFCSIVPPPPAPHSLEFWVGGYGSDLTQGHEVWKIEIVNGSCNPPAPAPVNGQTGLFWGGQPAPIYRLVMGFDPELRDKLVKGGMDATVAASIVTYLSTALQSQLLAPTMLVQDAIELADFLVETTKGYYRFLPGADVVGGETDIAVVTRYEGFKWIKRKHYYPAQLNPLETDHV